MKSSWWPKPVVIEPSRLAVSLTIQRDLVLQHMTNVLCSQIRAHCADMKLPTHRDCLKSMNLYSRSVHWPTGAHRKLACRACTDKRNFCIIEKVAGYQILPVAPPHRHARCNPAVSSIELYQAPFKRQPY